MEPLFINLRCLEEGGEQKRPLNMPGYAGYVKIIVHKNSFVENVQFKVRYSKVDYHNFRLKNPIRSANYYGSFLLTMYFVHFRIGYNNNTTC